MRELAATGTRVALLPFFYDVDTPQDLWLLACHLRLAAAQAAWLDGQGYVVAAGECGLGVALLVAIFVPVMLSPKFIFAFSGKDEYQGLPGVVARAEVDLEELQGSVVHLEKVVDGEAKRHTLQLVRKHHGFAPESVIAAGDGANDNGCSGGGSFFSAGHTCDDGGGGVTTNNVWPTNGSDALWGYDCITSYNATGAYKKAPINNQGLTMYFVR